MTTGEPEIVVLSPVWNARSWIEKCLDSVAIQRYPRIRHIVVDDASTDGTREILQSRMPTNNLILNETRRFPSFNVWNAITNHLRGECVIALLDGDDWLLDAEVATDFAALHGTIDVAWSTYTLYERDRAGRVEELPEPPNPLHERRGDPRRLGWKPTHLFTFKRSSFLRIDIKDFQDDDGHWFGAMYDMAISVPLIEIAGWDRCAFLPRATYGYNHMRAEHDDIVRKDLQQSLEMLISNRKPYMTTRESVK